MWARSAWIFFRSRVCCVTSYRDHWARKQRWADWGRLATLKTSFWEIGCIIDYTVVYSLSDHFLGSIFYVFVKEIKFSIAQKERCQKWLLFRRFLGIGNRKKELLGKVSANELAKCNLVAPHRGIFGNNDCYCVYALYLVCQHFWDFQMNSSLLACIFFTSPIARAIHPPQLCLGLRS